MSPYVQMFLFLFKSKYRRKSYNKVIINNNNNYFFLYLVIIYTSVFNIVCSTKCSDLKCINGECVNGTCVCFDGWRGPSCQSCTGKVKLSGTSGYIHDGVGNYSLDVKCSWLIDGSAVPNSSIRLHVDEFATECGWDYLYIYDGDSVHSPLLAVYSGLMYKGDYSVRRVPEVVAQSGYALIHFYSDAAYNMTGFNISYRLNSCPSRVSDRNCSGHGVCLDGVCTCDGFYTGSACDVPICPNNCSYSNGLCHMEKHKCDCSPKYKGEDCSQVADLGYWEVVEPKNSFLPRGSASHSAVVWKDSLYIIGGESYHAAEMMYTYDFTGNVWETVHMDMRTSPTPRYGHSAVIFGDKIYLYGGVKSDGTVCNELWAFDVSAKSWENITVRADPCNGTVLCGPLKSAGHTATLVSSKNKRMVERMVVIFGHSPVYGYLNTVQEYYFGTREWNIVTTRGFPVKAGYGHSSAWDSLTEKIYVYGGFISESPASPQLSNRLYSYEPDSHIWTLLSSGPSARFLHTGTFLNGLMLVFGGNTHNDTALSRGAKCYSADFLSYDVVCDSWASFSVPPVLVADLPRFGHSAVTFNNSLYIYGGFDGQMLNDLLRYTSGTCENLASMTACLNTRPGMKCVWDKKLAKCGSAYDIPVHLLTLPDEDIEPYSYARCPEERRSTVTANIVTCGQLNDCLSCVHTSLGCGWCPHTNSCTHEHVCKQLIPNTSAYTSIRAVTQSAECAVDEGAHCPLFHSCQTCSVQPQCLWTDLDNCNSTVDTPQESVVNTCGESCSELTSCLNCTQKECIWCHNEQRCVDKTAYTASFPYGQCREWSTQRSRCPLTPGESACMSHKWCLECRDAPECGWCDDGTGTGKGVCLPGGNNPPPNCAKKHWYFTHCPSCQCNGHSTCANNSSVCVQPCANLTHGEHCETCIPGYYGYPVNGGNCTPCECNNHGTHCVPDTGKCYCTTKGIIGDHCERCDLQNHYHGDPTNHGSCFYDLTIDYQFTFNLSKKDDRYYTQINFKNSPPKPDVDADFTITCSVMAKMNITIKTVNQPERPLLYGHNCSNYKTRFNKNEHSFGVVDNVTLTTFYVYVYDFQPPLWIQISFSQYPKLNLQQFFITFSSCFLLLLLVAAVLWKIKQKYDMYRRRQRLFVEMEQMASRPFSQVLVEIEKRTPTNENTPTTPTSKKKECPSPIALEPCSGNRAAVLSLLVRLPTGGAAFTPHGQSAGLAIASALVTLGNPRKVSIDTVKGDPKSKSQYSKF
ncbi:attractin-like protein dsd isoform X2 [Rhodnius prolixus]|uniref:attractin-like protein dsd isoform X2 n=1 Tax=Rhodnius prolixus TaxID=13249 RepID=UPI003D18B7D4